MRRKAYVIGQPDPVGCGWLDEVQKVCSPGYIKAIRVSRGELHLVAIPNKQRDKYELKKMERKAEREKAKV